MALETGMKTCVAGTDVAHLVPIRGGEIEGKDALSEVPLGTGAELGRGFRRWSGRTSRCGVEATVRPAVGFRLGAGGKSLFNGSQRLLVVKVE